MRYPIALVLTLSLTIVGCGAGSDTDQYDVGSANQTVADDDIDAAAQGGSMGGFNTEISLDPEIADAWSGVRVRVVDLETADTQTIDVQLGETVALGDSGLTLSAEIFIPDFVMDEGGITSRSAETHNPAARVIISEVGAITFEGWLFAAMTEIHPFPHHQYQVLLVEGIPAD